MRTFGIDIAAQGQDKSVLVVLDIHDKAHQVPDIITWSKADTMESVGRIELLYRRWKPDKMIIDADGLGLGPHDRLRELGYPVIAFHGSARCDYKDMTYESGFVNMRSYAYWHLKEIFDPSTGYSIKLPHNENLIGELCAISWKVRSGSMIAIQSKDEIKKKLGRSPDTADALAYAAVDIDRSLFEESFAIHHGRDISKQLKEELRPQKSEEEAIEQFMWGRANKRNVDIFDLY